ncbi:hypothetical protein BD410DRAFT_230115 [Rickenella mellea]|uniref:Uncharacterized protein n=1 Tax=Rickenella mellea TaxID=50990 RepID=A0A4Y7QNA7_9AGAM|nr:hypothetical protein BD410DRAFT_230115 [Rickenella mellea]
MQPRFLRTKRTLHRSPPRFIRAACLFKSFSAMWGLLSWSIMTHDHLNMTGNDFLAKCTIYCIQLQTSVENFTLCALWRNCWAMASELPSILCFVSRRRHKGYSAPPTHISSKLQLGIYVESIPL